MYAIKYTDKGRIFYLDHLGKKFKSQNSAVKT